MVISKCNSINDEDLGFLYHIFINESDEYPNHMERDFLVYRVDGEEWLVLEDIDEQELVFSSKHLHEAINFIADLEKEDRKRWYQPYIR